MAFKFFLLLLCVQQITQTKAAVTNRTIGTMLDDVLNDLSNKVGFLLKLEGACAPCRNIKGSEYCDCRNLDPMTDCLDFYNAGHKKNGLYLLGRRAFSSQQIFCDQTTQGGGWTVFQRRHDGSVDFQQNWATYRSGFGSLLGEFWLGNEHIRDLTKSPFAPKKSQLLINMRMKRKTQMVYAKYEQFSIGDEMDKYLLFLGKQLTGNVPSLTVFNNHNNTRFSTYDQDNDKWPRSCSQSYGRAGWWYTSCYNTLLNGVYKFTSPSRGEIAWQNGRTLLPEFVEMKFRRNI
ncbi:ficolin-2-like [Clytia hemisphaerica]